MFYKKKSVASVSRQWGVKYLFYYVTKKNIELKMGKNRDKDGIKHTVTCHVTPLTPTGSATMLLVNSTSTTECGTVETELTGLHSSEYFSTSTVTFSSLTLFSYKTTEDLSPDYRSRGTVTV